MDYLVQVAAAIIPMIVGFVWYGNMAFGKAWMGTVGLTEEKIAKGNMGITLGLAFLMSLILAMPVAYFVNHAATPYGGIASSNTFGHGMFHGMLLGVFVALPLIAQKALFQQLSFKYVLINVGYWVLTLGLMGGVLDQFLPTQTYTQEMQDTINELTVANKGKGTNLLGIALAGISSLLTGFLWYHPKTFGTTWMKAVGMTEEKMASGNMALIYGLAFLMAMMISTFVASIGAGHIEERMPEWQHYGFHGVQAGLIVAAPIIITNALFEMMDFKTILINAGYWVVTLGVMAAIIGAMGGMLV